MLCALHPLQPVIVPSCAVHPCFAATSAHARSSSTQDMATEFVNGTLGRVEEIVVDESNEEIVKAIRFRPDGSKNVLTIPRRKLQIAVKGVGMISRSQFPLIPA